VNQPAANRRRQDSPDPRSTHRPGHGKKHLPATIDMRPERPRSSPQLTRIEMRKIPLNKLPDSGQHITQY
jgi:hypothetical protein